MPDQLSQFSISLPSPSRIITPGYRFMKKVFAFCLVLALATSLNATINPGLGSFIYSAADGAAGTFLTGKITRIFIK